MSGILLGTHGGAGADGAARVASLLARRLNVPLTTLVVDQPIPVADYGYGVVSVPRPEDDEAVRRALLASVKEQLDRCEITDCVPQLRIGPVVSELAVAARALNADLIVTGLGPHDFLDRALGGETALRLAQTATVPVLAVPAATTTVPRRVLAATDFSPTSRLAAQSAARWLLPGDELHLVHVADRNTAQATGSGPAEQSTIAARLASLAGALGLVAGVRVETVNRCGDPARALLAYATQVDADLITVGSHGYGALKRLLLGSVASKVIRLATSAVLVAPAASAAFGR